MPFTKDTTYYVYGGQYIDTYTPSRITLYGQDKNMLGQVGGAEIGDYGIKEDLNTSKTYFSFKLTSSADKVANAKWFALTLYKCTSKPTVATVDFKNL